MRLIWLYLIITAAIASPSVYQVTGPDADQVLVLATQDSNDEVIVYFNTTETTCTSSYFLFQYPSTVRLIGLGSSETTLRECYFYFIRDAGDGQFEARGFDVIDLLYTNNANNPFSIVADHAMFTDVSFSNFSSIALVDLTTNEAELFNCSYSNGPFRNMIEGPQILIWLHSGNILMDGWTTDFLDWYGTGLLADGDDSASVTVRNSRLTGMLVGIFVQAGGQNQLHVYETHFTNFSAIAVGGSWYLAAYGSETLIENCTFSNSTVSPGFEGAYGGNFVSKNNIWSNVSALNDGMSLVYTSTTYSSYNELFTNCSGSIWKPFGSQKIGFVIDSTRVINHNNPYRGVIYSRYTSIYLKNCLFQNVVNINTAIIQIAPDSNIYRSSVIINCTFIDVLSWQGTISAIGFLGNLTIDGSSFIRVTSLHNGGAITISSQAGTISITNSQFTNCTANGNGGVAYMKINQPTSGNIPYHSLTVLNVTLEGNNAGDSGGGIYLIGHLPQIVMQNIRAYNQYGDVFGGVIFIGSSTELLQLSLLDIHNNIAGTSGGGIFIQGNISQIFLNNVSASSNSATFEGGTIVIGGTQKMTQAMIEDIQCSHSQSYFGSCISISSPLGNLTLNRVQVTYGEGQQGGAIQVSSAVDSLGISDCLFLHNQAQFLGGALSLTGTMQQVNLHKNTFASNSASQGGGIAVTGHISVMIMDGCMVTSNKGQGGGLYISPLQALLLSLDGTELGRNTASTDGGAIFVSSSLPVHMVMKNVTMHGNWALGNAGNSGGGSHIVNSDPRLTQVEWSNNHAAIKGGAINFVLQASLSMAKRDISSFEMEGDSYTLDITGSVFEGNISPLGTSVSTNGGTTITTSSFDDGSTSSTLISSNAATISESSINNGIIWLKRGSVMTLSLNNITGMFTLNMDNTATVIDGGGNTQSLRDNIMCNTDYQLNYTMQSSQCVPIPLSTTQQAIETEGQQKNTVIGAAVGSVVGIIIIAVVIVGLVMYRQSQKQKTLIRDAKYSNSYDSINFSVIQLGAAKRSVINFDNLQDMKKIGEGAYGIVYVAIFQAIQVAVKQIKAEMVTEAQLKDFLHEVSIIQGLHSLRSLSALSQNSVVGVLWTSSYQSTIHLSLSGSLLECFTYMQRVLDLAVRNILLTSHHDVKVADFGMSRTHKDDEIAGKTQSDVGPLKWMAPEAIINREYSKKKHLTDNREIMTGEEPYKDMSGIEAAIGVTTNGLKLQIPAQTDPKLSKLMSLCWENQPHSRPSFDEVCHILSIDEKISEEFTRESKDNTIAVWSGPTAFLVGEEGIDQLLINPSVHVGNLNRVPSSPKFEARTQNIYQGRLCLKNDDTGVRLNIRAFIVELYASKFVTFP
ncbi:hypothetical protein PROFUN_14776 [Planoprotostelium fungivorum]|uniref:Protein kinase domain-containing protein n=1 Tax=Planoprotostelium fungivorum TaxID=1890364 RepID=A0A2P6MYV9_9EUKA|nr:hypothetical protein PROFUN_14776 [Planoprotostelium fungivorum]